MTRSRRADHSGFSLVELLVVVFVLSIVGAIAAVGISRGLQADREARERIEAFEDMQVALERISQDVRAASTPLSDSAFVGEIGVYAAGQGIELEVLLDGDGTCRQVTYWVDDEGNLRSSQRQSLDSCAPATFGLASNTILMPRLDPDRTIFTFETADYEDGEREAAASPGEIRFVTITLTRDLVGQPPVTVRTVVGLRNA